MKVNLNVELDTENENDIELIERVIAVLEELRDQIEENAENGA